VDQSRKPKAAAVNRPVFLREVATVVSKKVDRRACVRAIECLSLRRVLLRRKISRLVGRIGGAGSEVRGHVVHKMGFHDRGHRKAGSIEPILLGMARIMNGVSIEDAPSPWYRGELEPLRRVGVVEQMHNIRDYMPNVRRDFFCDLPFAVLGVISCDGEVWATLIVGKAGFVSYPNR
jgi:hypothetical protein